MATTSASEVSVPVDGRKHTTCANCRGSGPSLALVGAGCSLHKGTTLTRTCSCAIYII